MCRQTNKICEKCGATKRQLVEKKGKQLRGTKIYCPICKAEADKKRHLAARLAASPEQKKLKAARVAAAAKERRRIEKEKVMRHYSKDVFGCTCCGINQIEFLTIDHIDGGGNKHRQEINRRAGYHFYRWLVKTNMPEGFQTLCYNCNNAKAYYGYCPHKKNS